VSSQTVTASPKRSNWQRDGKAKGIYYRLRTHGSKRSWAYYDVQVGKLVTVVGGRQAAIDARARAGLRKSSGQPSPNTNVLMRDLLEEVREIKRRKLSDTAFDSCEYVLDKILLPEIGDYRATTLGPDRCARLIRDMSDGTITGRPLADSSIRKYLPTLNAAIKLALRRGDIASNPLAQLSSDERPTGGGVRDHYSWSSAEISDVIAAAERLASRPDARYDYSPLLRVLLLLGPRIGEAQAIRVQDVDLLLGVLRVRHSWTRKGTLGSTKTKAGVRDVPLSPGLVELFARIIPGDADSEHFVFHAKDNPHRPISYWNFRRRGFLPALEEAGLADKGITVHGLRSAATSMYAASGLGLAEVAEVMGQEDPLTTWKHYLKLFDRSQVNERVRAAQDLVLKGEVP
jgi:integrase